MQLTLYQTDKILDWSKLKVFADVKISGDEFLKFDYGMAEKIVGKGENTGYQRWEAKIHRKGSSLVTSFFSFFHNVFKRLFHGCH